MMWAENLHRRTQTAKGPNTHAQTVNTQNAEINSFKHANIHAQDKASLAAAHAERKTILEERLAKVWPIAVVWHKLNDIVASNL